MFLSNLNSIFQEYEDNLKIVISKASQFGSVIELGGNEEKISVFHTENVDKMLFKLNLEVVLDVIVEGSDNEMEIDEQDVEDGSDIEDELDGEVDQTLQNLYL